MIKQILRSLIRLIFGERRISIKGEAGRPFYFRPSEYPSLLKGTKRTHLHIRREWSSLLHENEVILDIGANIGFTTQRFFSILSGKCQIWAFEPNPRNFELLEL